MKYLVCRKEVVDRGIKNSDLWPVIWDTGQIELSNEQIIREVVESMWPGWNLVGKSFYVIPLHEDATLVRFVPKQHYDVIVEAV